MLKLKHGLYLLTAALTLGLASLAQADYVAYSIIKEGGAKQPLPEYVGDIDVKYLVNLEWGRYSGKKTRIGVLPVENNSSSHSVSVSGPGGTYTYNSATSSGGVPVQGIEAMLMDVMHKSKRFRLVERKVLDQTLKEQDLGATGRIAKPSAAKIGKILGAQYLFQAVITHYEAGVEEKGGGLGGLLGGSAGALLGALSVKESKAVLGMNFRLINSETSEIIYTDQVEAELSESGLTFGGAGITGGGGLGGFMSKYAKTPIGQAVLSTINRGVYGLVKQTGTSPATGSVIKVKGNKIYLNLGQDAVEPGESLDLMRMGEQLIDPETGISLGGEEELVGSVKVTAAKEKYSIAKPTGRLKASRIKRGDKIVSQRAPEPMKFATSWKSPKKKSGFFGGGSKKETSSPFGDDSLF